MSKQLSFEEMVARELQSKDPFARSSKIAREVPSAKLVSKSGVFNVRNAKSGSGASQKKLTATGLARLILHDADVVTCVLFPFLNVPEHLKLAVTCRALLLASGVPHPSLPSVPKPAAWNKPVCMPNTTGPRLARICGVAQFRRLSLRSSPRLSDTALGNLGNQASLCSLDLLGCARVTNQGLKHLSKLPLQELNLCGTAVTDELAGLSGLPLLRCLSLESTLVTDKGMLHLTSLSHLESLSLPSAVTAEGLSMLTASLASLSLKGASLLTDDGLAPLAKMPLRHLDLDRAKHITDAGLAHLRELPLTRLCLRMCSQISDQGLLSLPRTLTDLDLSEVVKFTDAGVRGLSQLGRLDRLSLRGCRLVTDAGAAHLQDMSLLRHLSLAQTKVSDSGLPFLAGLPLRTLDLKASRVTQAGYMAAVAFASKPAVTHDCLNLKQMLFGRDP